MNIPRPAFGSDTKRTTSRFESPSICFVSEPSDSISFPLLLCLELAVLEEKVLHASLSSPTWFSLIFRPPACAICNSINPTHSTAPNPTVAYVAFSFRSRHSLLSRSLLRLVLSSKPCFPAARSYEHTLPHCLDRLETLSS